MKIHTILIMLFAFSLAGCHYNYAVKREAAGIPYENQYDYDDNSDYEFYSTLYKASSGKRYGNLVTITHLSDVSNYNKDTPEPTWRTSRLSFDLDKDTGAKVLPDSVVLQHYSKTNKRFIPTKVESTLSKCAGVIGCQDYIVRHYKKDMPKQLIEKVSFRVVAHGKEEIILYTIPLEYKYEYSFWDVLMGV